MNEATTDEQDDVGIAIIGMAGRFSGPSTVSLEEVNGTLGRFKLEQVS